MDKFCTKCGQKLAENAVFCTSCGNKVETQPTQSQATYSTPNQANNTTSNQPTYTNPNPNMYQGNPNPNMYQGNNPNPNMYQGTPNPNMYQGAPNPNMYHNHYVDPKVNSKNNLSIALSIVALVLSILGSILFGLFLSLPALALGLVSIIMAVNVKKASNNSKGTSAMVCGILAIVFAAVFTVGCLSCNSLDYTDGNYGCYGWAGGSCKANNDAERIIDEFDYEDALDEWFKSFN